MDFYRNSARALPKSISWAEIPPGQTSFFSSNQRKNVNRLADVNVPDPDVVAEALPDRAAAQARTAAEFQVFYQSSFHRQTGQ
jgi:hypothetical protein